MLHNCWVFLLFEQFAGGWATDVLVEESYVSDATPPLWALIFGFQCERGGCKFKFSWCKASSKAGMAIKQHNNNNNLSLFSIINYY